MNNKQKVFERVSHMAHSLFEDGYIVRININISTCCFIKLKHRKNGSVITIVGNYDSSIIKLTRDGRIRHIEQVK